MTTARELKVQIILVSVSLLSVGLGVVMSYFEGRSNSLSVIPTFLPAIVVPFLCLFVSCMVLFSLGIHSLYKKQHRIVVWWMFFLSLALCRALFFIDYGAIFARGFHDYAEHVLTPDEWRAISRFAQEHIKPDESISGPGKGLGDDAVNRAIWPQFEAATQIKKLPSKWLISVNSDWTEIEWGGALVGHRAVRVTTTKKVTILSDLPDYLYHPMSIREDIFTYLSD